MASLGRARICRSDDTTAWGWTHASIHHRLRIRHLSILPTAVRWRHVVEEFFASSQEHHGCVLFHNVNYYIPRGGSPWAKIRYLARKPIQKKSSGGRCSPDCFSIAHGHAIDMIRTRKVGRDAALEWVYRLAMCPRHHKYINACALVGWLDKRGHSLGLQ